MQRGAGNYYLINKIFVIFFCSTACSLRFFLSFLFFCRASKDANLICHPHTFWMYLLCTQKVVKF